MESDLKMFTCKEVPADQPAAAPAATAPAKRNLADPAPAANKPAETKPAHTKEESEAFCKIFADWGAGAIQYGVVDIGDGEKYKDVKEQIIDPFYTGPPDRATPAIFVLQGTLAYVITGPDSVGALKNLLPDLKPKPKTTAK